MEAITLPNRAKVEPISENRYSLTLEPLYPGYGVTLGNALRRVLLSSMPGAAVTAVKIKFADHEFSTVPHVKEDVIQLILNFKQLRVRSYSQEPVKLQLKVKGERTVTGADITETDQVQVISKDLHIATLDSKQADFDVELTVEQGRGYLPVEAREHQRLEAGAIALDAIYTPVRSVHFDVTNVRVGTFTNFDKLVLSMETDGSISGDEAFDVASHILVDHFSMCFTGAGAELVAASAPAAEAEASTAEPTGDDAPSEPAGESEIEQTTLSTRAKNALSRSGVASLAQLKAMTQEQLSGLEGLGDKTIAEITDFISRQ